MPMKVDTDASGELRSAPAEAAEAEDRGYDTMWSTEIKHDPFLALLLGAQASSRIELGTGIAVAFARNPMTVAATAWDLAAFSGGRFLLGLGSQVRPHVERRFSMPWSHPAPRMREFVLALRAIWARWQDGIPLAFEGEFYRHTLMTPFFDPGPIPSGPPRVLVAAVGEAMTAVAAEVADGMLVHAFTTEAYLRQVTLPTIERGLAARGARRADFELVYPALVVTGDDEPALEAARAGTRRQIAFYASTPAYRAALELHGWADLQPELQRLSKADRWAEMGRLITDEVLDAFAVTGKPEEVPGLLRERFDGVVDRIRFYLPYAHEPALRHRIKQAW